MAAHNGIQCKAFLIAATFSAALGGGAYAQDPPNRVARLNYIAGNVSFDPAGSDQWAPAVINRPLTTGDALWSDTGARAEIHLNNAVLRLSSETSMGFLNLDDRMAQVRFSEGELFIRVRRLHDDEAFEVDTPNSAITILQEGEYLFNATPDTATTYVTVRHGGVNVTGGGQSFNVQEGSTAQISGEDQVAYDVQYAQEPDQFEGWSEERDGREARVRSAHYLPPDVVGYEDLDGYGNWREQPGYGAVWYPTVDAGWAPYHQGHWAWIEPWGWSWVDDAPWGFAPSHYGRWAFIGNAWGWVPGPVALVGGGPGVAVIAPVYAPALVAFIGGGGGWGVSLSFGAPAVGWVPLGPGEIYTPAYRMSPAYFRSANVSSTTVVNNVNITNVYNTVYVNKTVTNVTANARFANMAAPNAVTAMPQNAFASGRPVSQAGVAVPRNMIAKVQAAPIAVAPAVAPTKQSLAPSAGTRPAVQPPARILNTRVVAKVAPPPAPVPFAAKQAILQQNAGKPVDMQAIRQAAPPRTVAAAPMVRVAPPSRPAASAPTPQPRPVQATRPPTAPPQTAPGIRPAAPQTQPAYRPPTAQPAPATRPPAPQPQPSYRPPAAQQPEERPAPIARPAAAQQPEERPAPAPPPQQPSNRPPATPPQQPQAQPKPAPQRPPQQKPAPKPPPKEKQKEEKE